MKIFIWTKVKCIGNEIVDHFYSNAWKTLSITIIGNLRCFYKRYINYSSKHRCVKSLVWILKELSSTFTQFSRIVLVRLVKRLAQRKFCVTCRIALKKFCSRIKIIFHVTPYTCVLCSSNALSKKFDSIWCVKTPYRLCCLCELSHFKKIFRMRRQNSLTRRGD